MRIHTSLDYHTISHMLDDMHGVYFGVLSEHGSRSRDRAFEVQLRGNSPRRPNDRGRSDDYAATWDEWGIFLNKVFEADDNATCTYYKSAADFHYQTDHRFETLTHDQQHKNHNFEFHATLGERTCKCGAVKRWKY